MGQCVSSSQADDRPHGNEPTRPPTKNPKDDQSRPKSSQPDSQPDSLDVHPTTPTTSARKPIEYSPQYENEKPIDIYKRRQSAANLANPTNDDPPTPTNPHLSRTGSQQSQNSTHYSVPDSTAYSLPPPPPSDTAPSPSQHCEQDLCKILGLHLYRDYDRCIKELTKLREKEPFFVTTLLQTKREALLELLEVLALEIILDHAKSEGRAVDLPAVHFEVNTNYHRVLLHLYPNSALPISKYFYFAPSRDPLDKSIKFPWVTKTLKTACFQGALSATFPFQPIDQLNILLYNAVSLSPNSLQFVKELVKSGANCHAEIEPPKIKATEKDKFAQNQSQNQPQNQPLSQALIHAQLQSIPSTTPLAQQILMQSSAGGTPSTHSHQSQSLALPAMLSLSPQTSNGHYYPATALNNKSSHPPSDGYYNSPLSVNVSTSDTSYIPLNTSNSGVSSQNSSQSATNLAIQPLQLEIPHNNSSTGSSTNHPHSAQPITKHHHDQQHSSITQNDTLSDLPPASPNLPAQSSLNIFATRPAYSADSDSEVSDSPIIKAQIMPYNTPNSTAPNASPSEPVNLTLNEGQCAATSVTTTQPITSATINFSLSVATNDPSMFHHHQHSATTPRAGSTHSTLRRGTFAKSNTPQHQNSQNQSTTLALPGTDPNDVSPSAVSPTALAAALTHHNLPASTPRGQMGSRRSMLASNHHSTAPANALSPRMSVTASGHTPRTMARQQSQIRTASRQPYTKDPTSALSNNLHSPQPLSINSPDSTTSWNHTSFDTGVASSPPPDSPNQFHQSPQPQLYNQPTSHQHPSEATTVTVTQTKNRPLTTPFFRVFELLYLILQRYTRQLSQATGFEAKGKIHSKFQRDILLLADILDVFCLHPPPISQEDQLQIENQRLKEQTDRPRPSTAASIKDFLTRSGKSKTATLKRGELDSLQSGDLYKDNFRDSQLFRNSTMSAGSFTEFDPTIHQLNSFSHFGSPQTNGNAETPRTPTGSAELALVRRASLDAAYMQQQFGHFTSIQTAPVENNNPLLTVPVHYIPTNIFLQDEIDQMAMEFVRHPTIRPVFENSCYYIHHFEKVIKSINN